MSDRSALTRLLAVVAIVGLLVVAGVVDRRPRATRSEPSPPVTDAGNGGAVALSAPTAGDAVLLGPTASASGSLSTTWYCAGGPSGQGDGGRTTLVLANRSPVTSRAQVTVFGNGVATQRRVVQVLGSSRLELSLTSILKAPTTGAVIEGTGGGLAVAQRLTTPSGADATPCTTRASSQWYFADGSTAEGATQTITLFNPFPDPVTADVSFLTVDGYRQPPPFSGVPVPPGSVVSLDVAKVQNRRASLATIVSTRTGRLIAASTQAYDGTGPKGTNGSSPSGMSFTLGAPRALSTFVFPLGLISKGLGARVAVANPGRTDSTVRLDITLDDPAVNGQPPPMTLHIPATSTVQLGPKALRQIPAGIPFTVHGRVLSGGPVTSELTLDGTDPAKGHGTTTMQASPVLATDWVLPAGLERPSSDVLTVVSPGSVATISITAIDAGRRILLTSGTLPRVPKGGITTLDLHKLLGTRSGATVVVHASVPVAVARLQSGHDAQGLSLASGIPVVTAVGLLP